MNSSYQPVIGLEIHVELKTKSGMFCRCKVNQFTAESNSHVCPVCLGMPGALPVPNQQAIEWTIKIGQALNCKINKHTKFDRKHYSYPDLAKGYQISQYDEPIATNGLLRLKIKNLKFKIEEKVFRIHRVHLEEDTGKLIHRGEDTLVDFNRSGTPLVEIVTEPDFESADDVKIFLEELHTIIRYLDVSDADMEKGTMRMEPNISVKRVTCNMKHETCSMKHDNKLPPYKVEVKNINSFNFVKRAIEYEVKRHIEILEKGETPIQETRGWDSNKNITYSQRTKEEAHDYRYFPEPDIPPFEFSDEYLKSIQKTIPELPQQKMDRYINNFQLKDRDAFILTRDKDMAKKFELVLSSPIIVKQKILPQEVANLFINKLNNKLSLYKTDKALIEEVISTFKLKEELKNYLPPKEVLEKIIAANPKVVNDYKSGKLNAIMYLVGQVMRELRGKADASSVIIGLKTLITDVKN